MMLVLTFHTKMEIIVFSISSQQFFFPIRGFRKSRRFSESVFLLQSDRMQQSTFDWLFRHHSLFGKQIQNGRKRIKFLQPCRTY